MIHRDNHEGEMTFPTQDVRRFAETWRLAETANLGDALAARYRLLLDNSGFPVSYMDRDGQFLFITNRGASNLGDTPENVAGRTVYDYFPPQDADEYVRRFREVIDNDRELTFEDEVVFADGKRWFWSILHPFKDSDGRILGVQVASHDVTARKASEAALEDRFRFEQLVANLATGFVSLSTADVSTTICGGLRSICEFVDVDRSSLLQFSDDYQRLECMHESCRLGSEPEKHRLQQLTNAQFPQNFQMLLRGDTVVLSDASDLATSARTEWETLSDGGSRSLIVVPIRQAGRTLGALCLDRLELELKWTEVLGQRVAMLGQMLFSFLESKRVENELHESRQLVHAATDASPHVTYVFDLTELSILYISPQVEQELGYTPDEVYEMGAKIFTEHLHPEDTARLGELFARWLQVESDEVLETEVRLKRADGVWRWYASRDRILKRAAEGYVLQIIGSMRDVTNQKLAEEELQFHREKLIHVSRLSIMGEMAAGIAHELGQPLYSVLNYSKASQNALNGYNDPRIMEAKQWNEQVVQAAARAGEIIRRLRDFARRSVPKRESLDMRAVIEEAVSLVAFESRRLEIRIERDVTRDPLFVRSDRVQLLQVLVNLIQNGNEAMSETPSDQRILKIRATRSDGFVEVSVNDRGRGLPTLSASIFDAFMTTKEEGMGLGLAICKTLVESHGGKIEAQTNEHGGASFRFVLPSSVGIESDGE